LIVYILPSSWSSSFAQVEPASDTVITASGPRRGVSKPRRETGMVQIQDSKPADRLPTDVAPRVRPYAVPYGHDDPAASRVPEPPPAVASVPIEEPGPAAPGDQRLPTNAITATHDEHDDDPAAAGARMASEVLLRAQTLKQAISLQDQGKLPEALVLFHRIFTEYANAPAGPEALRRQKEIEGILTRREASEQLRQALELQEAGQRSEARWLLEDTVRKYRNTPAALEAARRLERMGQTTGN